MNLKPNKSRPDIKTSELVQRYFSGESLVQLSVAFGITPTAIMYRLRKAGRTCRPAFHKVNTPDLRKRKCLLNGAQRTARQHGLPFDITLDDICIPNVCPALGIPIVLPSGIGRTDNSPSIDKIIPSKGYVRGNVWVISLRANRIKNDATVRELRAIACAIENKLGEIKCL